MFVKLIALQTCETQILQDQDPDYAQSGIKECQGAMPAETVVFITHGQYNIEILCQPCAKLRFDTKLT